MSRLTPFVSPLSRLPPGFCFTYLNVAKCRYFLATYLGVRALSLAPLFLTDVKGVRTPTKFHYCPFPWYCVNHHTMRTQICDKHLANECKLGDN